MKSVLLACLLSIGAAVSALAQAEFAWPGPLPLAARGHSHNDYQQARPLADALEQRLYSVEADVWLRGGKVMVGHLPVFLKGDLETLYLQPLQKLVDERGSVYGDGLPVYLWIDIKDGRQALRKALKENLDRYPMLSLSSADGLSPKVVTVILTGNEASKAAFMQDYPVRPALRDSNVFSESDPPSDGQWTWYALQWGRYFGSDGAGALSLADRRRLQAVVEAAHRKGRRVRLFDLPESEDLWQEAFGLGVDQLSADDLPRLRRFLDAQRREDGAAR